MAALTAIIGSAIAATAFVPEDQPWGYVAEPALSARSLSDGKAVAYVPWFETGTLRGDILALPLSESGTVGFVPDWRASVELDQLDWDLKRNIVTSDGAGKGIPFRWDSLTDDQKVALDANPGDAQKLLNFIRGDRSNEGGDFRERNSVMGTVIHSSPEFVGGPKRAYAFADYITYADQIDNRKGRVYVASNDGMLHVFDSKNGKEKWAYVPSMILSKLHRIADPNAGHSYLVDGHITTEDARVDGAWGTYLVGGLGAGGKGLFALDITDPDPKEESKAADQVMWEITPSSPGASNLGYTYGRPSIVRLDNSGTWYVIVSNGYQSDSGAASLFIIDLKTGGIIREIVVTGGADNGLSSPTVVDADLDGFADTAYAGDRNGNLWKFDLQSGTVVNGTPLFRTAAGQPITTAPEVGNHPESGLMVYIGTGELMRPEDGEDLTAQAIYGIWDRGLPVYIGQLSVNKMRNVIHGSGVITRTMTNNQPDWNTHRGWVIPAVVSDASTADRGERVLQEMALRNGRLSVTLVNPTIPTGENWLIMVDAVTGGPPSETILDINEDNILNVADNSDGNNDGEVMDEALDRVIGQYQEFGLASRPFIVRQDGNKDSLLINHLAAIPPTGLPPIPDVPDLPDIDITNEFGVYGGHFDVDTSSGWYDFDDGETDEHVHEWDDKYNRTTIDLFSFPGKLIPIGDVVNGSTPFFLTVGNTALSSSAVLEINGVTISAVEYHEMQNEFMAGVLKGGKDTEFPLYILNPPTGDQEKAGIRQLTSLKVSFSAYAIVTGGLIPTETGCVRGNDMGVRGEYRNGAFIVQALNSTGFENGFLYNSAANEFAVDGGPTSIHGEHGHATSNTVLYETSVFWHWDGDCYHESSWESDYQACVVNGGCWSAALADDAEGKGDDKDADKDDDKDDDKDADPDPDPDPDPTPDPDPGAGGGGGISGEEQDPEHNLSETTILGNDPELGRLFWREIVPE